MHINTGTGTQKTKTYMTNSNMANARIVAAAPFVCLLWAYCAYAQYASHRPP